jgi:hypothetical protein
MQKMHPHHTSLADEPEDPVELMTENLYRIQQQVSRGTGNNHRNN